MTQTCDHTWAECLCTLSSTKNQSKTLQPWMSLLGTNGQKWGQKSTVRLSSACCYHMLGKGSREEAGNQPCRAWVALWCCWWDPGSSAPMAFVTQHQIQKVRNHALGRSVAVVHAGDTTCKIWSLLVNLWPGLAKICFTNALYSSQLLVLHSFWVCEDPVVATNSPRGHLVPQSSWRNFSCALLSPLLSSHPWTWNLPVKG